MLIAHDLGTTGDKASLHEDDGRLVRAVTVAYPTHYGRGGVVEQDPAHWWNAVCRATRELLRAAEVDPQQIRGVGFSGQMMGVVLLDEHGEPVRPSIIWADTRSSAQCRLLEKQIGAQTAYRTLGHRLNPTYSLSKLMWVRDHEPEVFARARRFCLAKDFVVHRLTGRLATDPTDASSTNAFDQRQGTWSTELIAAADLPETLFPEIVASTTVIGAVTAEAASASGLAPGTPVVLGGGDGPMAAIGAGVLAPSDGAYAYLGSSSWLSLASDEPLLDLPDMQTMTFDHVVPGRFVPTATMQAGGGSLSWIADLLSGTDNPADAERFERLVRASDSADASQSGLYFLPHLLGERSPYWNPHARGAFVGIGREHGPAHLTRAVLEGVAFNLSTCLDVLRDRSAANGGPAIDHIDAIGGGAASDTWLQIMADVFGATVARRSIVEEANSLGAAVTTLVGVGLLPDFSVARTLSTVTAVFEPDAERTAGYRAAHQRFLDAYRRLEPWFDEGSR